MIVRAYIEDFYLKIHKNKIFTEIFLKSRRLKIILENFSIEGQIYEINLENSSYVCQ